MRDYIQFHPMGFLSADNQDEIKRLFQELDGEVHLIVFTQKESRLFIPGQKCETCKDTGALLAEVASLSEKIKLEVHEFSTDSEAARAHDIDRIPSFVMTADGVKGKVRYFGMPSGYEFSVLLGSLLDVSKGKSELSEPSIEMLQKLNTNLHIQVFVTPT